MRLLFKFPTRGRPIWFIKTLDLYMRMLSGKHEVEFMVAMDIDDETMRTDLMNDYLCQIEPPKDSLTTLTWYWKEHKGKVDAINSCIPSKEFDIVTVISDDIEPQQFGYDDIIAQTMKEAFPDLDGVIYFSDGRTRGWTVSIPIFGRTAYMRRGYYVHPDFVAWGDNFTSKELRTAGNLQFFPQVLLRHCWCKYAQMDDTYARGAEHKIADARTYERLNAQLQKEGVPV